MTRAEAIRDAVVERYLDGHKPSTAETIAETLGVSPSTVRKTIREHSGNVPGTVVTNSFDRKTRFVPERAYLAELLKAAREE